MYLEKSHDVPADSLFRMMNDEKQLVKHQRRDGTGHIRGKIDTTQGVKIINDRLTLPKDLSFKKYSIWCCNSTYKYPVIGIIKNMPVIKQ